jgi:hypothetical protein
MVTFFGGVSKGDCQNVMLAFLQRFCKEMQSVGTIAAATLQALRVRYF